jgi:hypothetical protein
MLERGIAIHITNFEGLLLARVEIAVCDLTEDLPQL